MLIHLIMKDIRGYWRYITLTIFLPGILWALLVFIPYRPLTVSVSFCSFAIFAAISYFSFSEKKQKLDVLMCSLPVSRASMVIARYLFSLGLTVLGIILYGSTVYISSFLYSNPATEFHEIFRLRVLLTSLCIVSISSSIFLPALYRFRIMGMVLTFAATLVIVIYLKTVLFLGGMHLVNPHIESSEILHYLIFTFCIVVLPVISALISVLLYRKKEL